MKKLKIFENSDLTAEQVKSKLTEKEFDTFNSLVRLGDSIELAYNTVIGNRNKVDNSDNYRRAYE